MPNQEIPLRPVTDLGRRRLAIETQPKLVSLTPNAGRTTGGTAVTISGFNFANNADGSAPTVTIGGLAATSVVVVDSNTITCVTAASTVAGLFDVVVTRGSQSGTLYGVFTYYAATITRITPAFGSFAGGTDVLIEGFNFVAGSVILFGGSEATNVVVIDDQHIECTTPNHAAGFVDVDIIEPFV
jgi:hypothetical protein